MTALSPALRQQVDALSAAITADDERAARRCLRALAPLARGHWCTTLTAVIRQLHRELDSLPPSAVGAFQALPDAHYRLEHVVRLTEQAANQTLDCIEASQHISESLSHHRDPAVRDAAAALRTTLRDAAVAQTYQDITGQLLRQVAGILMRLRTTLDELVEDSGVTTAPVLATGPQLPGSPGAATQDDADRLLESFGS